MKTTSLGAFLLLALLLASCQQLSSPTATMIASDTPLLTTPTNPPTLTSTLTPTNAPTMTNTPVPTNTATPTPQPTPPGGGGKLLFSASGGLFKPSAIIPPGEYNLYLANPDGGSLTSLTQGPDGTSNLLAGLSPDGQQVLYYSTNIASNKLYQDNNRVDLWVTSIQKTQPLQLTSNQVHSYIGAATWAPDGTIYFVGWSSEGLGLFHVKSDGTGLERSAKPVGAASNLAHILFFDPQSRGVFWVAGAFCYTNDLCGAKYYYTSLDGSDQKQVWGWINNAATDVSLSPDGKWIAYNQFISNQTQDQPKNGCYISATDGSQIQHLPGNCEIQPDRTNFWPPWSLDGKSILYHTTDLQNHNYPVHLYSPDQKSVSDVPDLKTAGCFFANWLPSGKQILFSHCLSNFGGFDQYAPMRLVDLISNEVTVYPATGACLLAFSPDLRQVFLYNCYSEVGAKTLQFFKLDLETATLSPLFMDILNKDQKSTYKMYSAFWNGSSQ